MIPAWIVEYASLLVRGLQTTIAILLISSVFGFVLAVLVALARISKNRVIAKVSLFYTSVTRGTPLLIQIYIFYYGLGSLFAQFPLIRGSFLWPYLRDGYWYIVFALVVSVGAYVGEVIRGGLLAVPKGEMEAASAFGMTPRQALLRVRLPRALRLLLPTLAGETVMLLKSTALASTIAVIDLLGAANVVRAQTLQVYEPLLLVAGVYVCLTFLIEALFRLRRAPWHPGTQVRMMKNTPLVDRSLQGIGLCTLGYAFLSLQDAGIKWLVADYSVFTILFWRALVVVLACLLIGRLQLVRRAWRSSSRRLLVVRGLLSIAAWLLYYTAARDLTLAEMTTLYFSAPIMVTVLATAILKERVNGWQWFTLIIGFIGVVIACRPEQHGRSVADCADAVGGDVLGVHLYPVAPGG